MSSIIETISFEKKDQKQLNEKLFEHLALHRLEIQLINNEKIYGLLGEIGSDYLLLIEEESEVIIPEQRINYIRYEK